MNQRGSFDEERAGLEAEETSGVTSLAPVPVKTMRLSGLSDSDRTHFFHVSTLLERGKALAARDQQQLPPAPAPEAVVDEPIERFVKVSLWQRVRDASFARKASAVVLPFVAGMLLLEPILKKPEPPSAPPPAAQSAAPPLAAAALPAEPEPATALPTTAPEVPLTLPRGVSLEKAAVDAVAGGDFQRALTLYRELYRRSPSDAAYQQAVKILERRLRVQAP